MKYFIANWKMNMNAENIENWFEQFNKANPVLFENKVIIICPSNPYLQTVKTHIKTKNTFIGAQNVDIFDKGAHTGSIGAFQLKDFCDYSIIGHSELKEDEKLKLQKRDVAIQNHIMPIVCFTNPENASSVEYSNGLIAWEDPQNISINGEYRAKDPSEIKQAVQKIKGNIKQGTALIYGGSVNKDNIKNLAEISEIDGVLVGNASLDPTHFLYIIENA